MNKGLRIVGLLIFLYSLGAWAIDPVSWSLSPATGFPPTKVGEQSTVQYTFTNNLPFAATVSIDSVITGGNFSVHNDCYNKALVHGASCTVVLGFNPASGKRSAFQLIYGYNKNRIALPTLAVLGVPNSSKSQLIGSVYGLPPAIYKGSQVTFKAIYTNKGSTTLSNCTFPSFTRTGVPATVITSAGIPACGSSLLPGSSCQMGGSVLSNELGSLTLIGHADCQQEQVAPKASTVVLNKTGCLISARVALALPEKTYQYANNIAKFEFVNQCTGIQKLGQVILKTDSVASIIKGSDTCSGKNLASHASCSVLVSLMSDQLAADLTLSAILPYMNNTVTASAHTSEQVQALPAQAGNHTVVFVNQCDYPVWYSFTNGNGANYPSSPDPTPANQRSFNDYKLSEQVTGLVPATKVLAVNEFLNGALYARTGCNPTTGQCATANCEVIANTGTCKLGVQPNPPQTKFELNIASSGFDGIYDVSVINGFNVPGAIQSLAPIFSGPTPAGNIPYPFNCGQTAGGLIQPNNGLGACSWAFTPPSHSPDTPANYQWVSGGSAGSDCSSNADCSGLTCGMTSPAGDGKIYRRCGLFLGYWTLADYIGYSSAGQWELNYDLYSLYDMASKLTPIGTGSTDYGKFKAGSPPAIIDANYSAMYGCIKTTTNALNTGYNAQPTNNDKVCGCYNWDQSTSVAKTAQVTPCTGFNSQWTSTVFPRISWLKKACPTAYAYQYDDKSSQFQCNRPMIKTSYQVTFCPGGKTGKPS